MKIMKKILFFAAVMGVAFTSCMNEEFIGDNSPTTSQGTPGAISFAFDVPQATRAGGEDAAIALGKRFIVYGEKSESTGSAPSAGNYVFPNYQVNYGANTAYTTTSNTKDWEYVGFGHSAKHHANITTKDGSSAAVPAPGAMQTIKYWDYAATNYVFTAISADSTDINNDYVTIQKNVSGSTVYDKGYSVTLAAGADPTKLYFSDRRVIEQGNGADRTASNAYGGNVTLTFRNLVSQIRVAMYETIPGYTVTIDKFCYVDNASPTFATMTTEGTDKFYANVPNLTTDKAVGLTVTYINSGARENQPTVEITSGTANNYLALGGADAASTGLKATAVLGEDIGHAVYDKTDKSFTSVFPQEANAKSLKLKVNYTLTAPVTGETIKVYGATAEIPADYLQWKPNFKYTYIFKVSDNTDGKTKLPEGVNPGSPEGLYPITFDAVEIVAEDGVAEYITTVSEPSITTFGVKDSKYTTGKNEYEAGSDIYVTVVDGNVVVCPTLGTNINVYKATTPDADNFPITEASVAESLAEISVGAKEITVANINADGSTNFTTAPAIATSVPKEDGTTITSIKCVLTSAPSDWVASSDNVYYSDATCETKVTTAFSAGTYYKKSFALKLTGVKATAVDKTTAIVLEYIKTAATYHTTSEAHTFANASALTTWMSSNYQLYTDADGTTPATTASGTEVTYYKRTAVKTVGTYAYKVIRVQ